MDRIDEYREKMKADPRMTEELVADAQRYFVGREDDEADRCWTAIQVMHCRADDSVMAAMRKLAVSADAQDRAIAADVLAQVTIGNNICEPEACRIVMEMARLETQPEALGSLAYAMGHLGLSEGLLFLRGLAERPEADLRYAAAYSLPIAGKSDEAAVLDTMIQLMEDSDSDVRDWATFGVGTLMEVDSGKVRDALAKRMIDEDDDARREAMVGLAKRCDERVIGPFLAEIENLEKEIRTSSHLADVAEEILKAASRLENDRWVLAARILRDSGKSPARIT